MSDGNKDDPTSTEKLADLSSRQTSSQSDTSGSETPKPSKCSLKTNSPTTKKVAVFENYLNEMVLRCLEAVRKSDAGNSMSEFSEYKKSLTLAIRPMELSKRFVEDRLHHIESQNHIVSPIKGTKPQPKENLEQKSLEDFSKGFVEAAGKLSNHIDHISVRDVSKLLFAKLESLRLKLYTFLERMKDVLEMIEEEINKVNSMLDNISNISGIAGN